MVCFMLKYAKEFYLFGTFKRLFLFLFGLVCPLEVVSFSQLILGMDLELAEGYRDTLKNLKYFSDSFVFYVFVVYLDI